MNPLMRIRDLMTNALTGSPEEHGITLTEIKTQCDALSLRFRNLIMVFLVMAICIVAIGIFTNNITPAPNTYGLPTTEDVIRGASIGLLMLALLFLGALAAVERISKLIAERHSGEAREDE